MRLALLAGLLAFGAAGAEERFSLDGLLDIRAVSTEATPSFLYGGLGRLRFDDDHEGIRLGRVALVARYRIADTLTAVAVAEAYDDGDKDAIGLAEAFLSWRPYPRGPVRWQVKLGAFHLPVSLEHRQLAWTSPYTLSASALNTWIGEEFRVIGSEVEARWLGSSQGYRGDLALLAGAYGWNQGAGEVIAERGFALTDRPSLLFSGLGRPPAEPFQQFDGHAGYYGGLIWRQHDTLEIRALHYDNHADPGAHDADFDFAWDTRFNSVGLRYEPVSAVAVTVQRLDGVTFVGANGSEDQFAMRLYAWFALASLEAGSDRLSLRFDKFGTQQDRGFYGPPADDAGTAWTLALMHRLSPHFELAAEWLRVQSSYPPRAALGLPASVSERQLQLALRYRFRLGPAG
jgi:hypothetical protein